MPVEKNASDSERQLDLFVDADLLDGGEVSDTRDDRLRRIGWGLAVSLFLAVGGMILVNGALQETVTAGSRSADAVRTSSGVPLPPLVLSRIKVRDTVYTTDSLFLEVHLARQTVTVHFRSGLSRRFLISSGNPYIREGMATPSGVFTVQNQVPMAISKQFNNARLHHWIGVQGGVGFHGLDGSGYYGNLGVRPSSHGCIRMSREEIAQMYRLVHPGALIMVHSGNPARVVAFCASDDTVGARVIDSAAVYDRELGRDRMSALMKGSYWTSQAPRLVHRAGQRFRWGMQIGDASRIPRQELPTTLFAASFAPHLPVVRTDQVRVQDDLAAADITRLVRRLAMKERESDSLEQSQGMMGD